MEADTGKRGPNSRIEYEDLRKIPQTEITEAIMGKEIEEYGAEGEYGEAPGTYDIGPRPGSLGRTDDNSDGTNEEVKPARGAISAHSLDAITGGLMADPCAYDYTKKDVGE